MHPPLFFSYALVKRINQSKPFAAVITPLVCRIGCKPIFCNGEANTSADAMRLAWHQKFGAW